MEKQDLIRYRTFADALIRLNNAASTLLQEGADPEAIKLILSGTAKLFAELEHRMAQVVTDEQDRSLDFSFTEGSSQGWELPMQGNPPATGPAQQPSPSPEL